jgi:hypothetical protein
MPIVMLLTTSDIMRPDKDSYFSLARCRAAYHAFSDPVPHSSTLSPSFPARSPTLVSGTADGRQK